MQNRTHLTTLTSLLTLLLLILPLSPSPAFAVSSDLKQIHQNILDDIENSVPVDQRHDWELETIKKYMSAQQADGSYSDVDYVSTNKGNWAPWDHLARAYTMIRATQMPEHQFYQNQKVLESAIRSIKYSTARRWEHINWWHHEIGLPLTTYKLLMVYGDQLDSADRTEIMRLTRKGHIVDHPSGWSVRGTNLIWYAEITIALGVLYERPDWIKTAVDAVGTEVVLKPGYEAADQGIKPDASFWQHGQVFYSGGYGLGFSMNTARIFHLVQGSSLSFSQENYDVLSSYILNGQSWLVHRNVLDYSSMGRYYAREIGGDIDEFVIACKTMAKVKGPLQKEYRSLVSTLEKRAAPPVTGNKMFHFSDYMSHKRKNFSISVKMHSTRTINSDTTPLHEGLRSRFQSDGLTYIYRSGKEYQKIFPIWDYTRSPGTTEEMGEFPKLPVDYRLFGKTDFVGGVSDGTYGAAAMDYVGHQATGKKAWFFTDFGMIALGTDIDCRKCDQVVTSINQEWSKSDMTYSALSSSTNTGTDSLTSGQATLLGQSAIHSNQMGYAILDANARTVIQNEIQKGSWTTLFPNHTNKEPQSGKVSSIWIHHGASPRSAQYAYLVMPEVSSEQFTKAIGPLTQELEATNNEKLQAIHLPSESLTQAVFWSAGTLKWNQERSWVTTNAPMMVQIRTENGQAKIMVSDPTHRLKSGSVSWKIGNSQTQKRNFEFPQGSDAGSSLSI